jgi:ATP-binding cassette, subfamily C, bacterial CydC
MVENRPQPAQFRVLGFLLPAWRWVGLSTLLSTATIAAGIGLIGTSAYLISAAALQPSIAALQVAIVGVRFFGLSRGVFRYLERLVSHETNFRILANLRQWFYGRLELLAPAGLVDERGGDLLSRAIDDIDALELIYIRVVSPVLSALLVTLGMGWFIGHYDPGLAWALAGLLLTGGILLPLAVRSLSRNLAARQITQRASLSAFLVESLDGMADLLLFDRSTERREQLAALDTACANTNRRLALVSGMQSGLSQLLGGLATWLALIWLIPRVAGGTLDGVLLAVLALAASASFEAVAPLPAAGQYLDGSLAAARRLFELADREPAITENMSINTALSPGIPALIVRDLSLRYSPGLPPALSGISFELAPGKKLAIVGPNGAGKTSLVNVLLRFWDYQSGETRLGGVDLRELPPDIARSAFSLAAQNSHLFDTTLRENLTLGRQDIDPDVISRALAVAQLSDFVAHLPRGLDTPVGEHGLLLSGGERQRVILARALLKPAPILILDEPFSQLDLPTARKLYAAILNAYAQRSVITITHLFIGLEKMDEILVLQKGQILERGIHTELMRSGGLYSQYHNYQHESLAGSYQ